MGTPFYQVRSHLAREMNLWGGKVDGIAPSPSTFSSIDPQGSLFTVYDINRPEPDDEWDGDWMCINPGRTGDATLPTIWRRISDDGGYIGTTGTMTLTVALPSPQYAVTTMTYELFKTFGPEQWLMAINSALRTSYPQRHRIFAFEVPENRDTVFYDWGHFAAELSLADPVSAPTVSAVNDPGGKTNYWAAGNYLCGYNIYNAAGETLVSGTNSVTLSPTKVLEFAAITVPDNTLGARYWVTRDPGGTVLSQMTVGSGVLPDAATDNVSPQGGVADRTTLIVPKIRFWGPPMPSARAVPTFNTTGLDLGGLSVKTIRRRINPGQYPEQYVDLNPQWWREVGGTVIKLNYGSPSDQYALRFECMAPVRAITGESDSTEEPLEIMVTGGMLYLWNVMAMTGSSQNVTIWTAEAKIAEAKFTKARNLYQMPGPRKTMRRPYISVQRWIDNGAW